MLSVVSSFQNVLVLRTMAMYLILHPGLSAFLVLSVLLAALNHRWY